MIAIADRGSAIRTRPIRRHGGTSPVTHHSSRVTTADGYDAASQLIQVAQAGLVVGLGYDNANRRTSLTYPNGTSTSYSYDNASRVTAITHNGPAGLIESLSYAYDAAGNRISLTRTNGTATNLPQAVQAA
jgi:YD repeat-containing protein